MDRRRFALLACLWMVLATVVPAVGTVSAQDASSEPDVRPLPSPWTDVEVPEHRAELVRGVLAAADEDERPGLAVAQAAVAARQAEVGASIPANMSGQLDQEARNLQTAGDLLDDGSGGDALAQAIADARRGQAWQVRAGGFAPDADAAAPVHDTPSGAAAALLDRFGIERDAEVNASLADLDGLPGRVPEALAAWIDAYLHLEEASRDAYASADASKLPFHDNGTWDPERNDPLKMPSDWERPTTAEQLGEQGIDLSEVLPARDAFLGASQELGSALSDAGMTGASSSSSGPQFSFPPALAIDLRGNDTLYERDAALLLDVSGDDTYHNNAGGNTVLPPPGTAVISQDPCLQLRVNTTAPAVEIGSHSAAALLDLGGDDVYGDPVDPRNCGATGGAVQGVGMILDGGGSDAYHADNLGTNGGAFTGVGLIADAGGDDTYSAGLPSLDVTRSNVLLLVGSFGTNGAGARSGLGSIVDRTGDDTYRAGVFGNATIHSKTVILRLAEVANGGGAGEALSFVLDRAGHDTYRAGAGNVTWLHSTRPATQTARAANGGTSASASFLLDASGDDTYHAGIERFSWPVRETDCTLIANICSIWGAETGANGGSELGTAFLLDADGDDTYFGGIEEIDSQSEYQLVFASEDGVNGGGRAKGVGMLVDLAGDDTYFGGVRKSRIRHPNLIHVGSSTNGGGMILGQGMLVDADGSDTYTAGIVDNGFLSPPVQTAMTRGSNGGASLVDSHGLLVDLAGDDAYAAHGMVQENETRPFGPTFDGGVNGGAWNLGQGALVDLDGRDSYFAHAWGANGAAGGSGSGVCCLQLGSGILYDVGGQEDRYQDTEGGTGLDRVVIGKGNASAGLQLDGDQVPVVNLDRDTGHASIGDAVSGAGSGDTLIVRPGTYAETVTVDTGRDDLTLCSVRRDAYGCDAPATGDTILDPTGTRGPALEVRADDVTVHGLTIRGASPLVTTDGAAGVAVESNDLEMVRSTTQATTGLRLVSTTDARVEANRIAGNLYPGSIAVAIEGGSGATVRANEVRAAGTGVWASQATGATVEDNAFLVPPNSQFGGDSLGVSFHLGGSHASRGNLFDGTGTGLTVASSQDVESRSDRFEATGTGIALSAPAATQPTGFAAHQATLAGATTALHLAGEPQATVGLSVDAECNDWGAYHGATIAERIDDDGQLNDVDYQPWISAEDGGTGCLAVPVAAFTATPNPTGTGTTVTFDDESVPGSRPIVRWDWSFGDGDSATVVGEDDGTVTHSYAAPGTYEVLLTVEDADGQRSTVTGIVEIVDAAPVISPLADPVVDEGERLTFTVAASDADGDPIELSASGLPEGAAFHAPTGSFAWTPGFDQAGTYDVTFTATDGLGTDVETVTITVQDDPQDPTVDALAPTTASMDGTVVVDQDVVLRASAADADGTVTEVVFHPDGSGSDPVEATEVTDGVWATDAISYTTAGTKEILVEVTDDTGRTATDARSLEVLANRPPVARAATPPLVDSVDPTVVLDGSASSDPEGHPLTFSWTTSTGETLPDVTWEAWSVPPMEWRAPGAGTYEATLVVEDRFGGVDAVTVPIRVDDAIGVQADSTPFEPGPTEQVVVEGRVVDERGQPVADASLDLVSTHLRTGQAVQTTGTTAPDGSFEIQVPYDVGVAGFGVYLSDDHRVQVTASAPDRVDLDGEAGPETASTALSFDVTAWP